MVGTLGTAQYIQGDSHFREMGDGLNFAYFPGGRWEMVGVIGRREAGDRLATLRETGDSAKNWSVSQWEMGDSDPLSPQYIRRIYCS